MSLNQARFPLKQQEDCDCGLESGQHQLLKIVVPCGVREDKPWGR